VSVLAPHLAAIGELDKLVTDLEDAAKTLDGQTKQLEAAFSELL
jgi:hypothetical protein